MPSLLLLTFLLQLLIHAINTLGAQGLNELLWLLYTKLPTPQSKQAAQSTTLRREVVRLNREMNNISAQDDFAKWAKLRRQHDKEKEEYEAQSKGLQDFKTKFNQFASILRWLATTGLRFVLQFWVSKEPMFWLPKGSVPYYVEWLLSFPRAPVGSVSVNVWFIACASVIAMVSEMVVAFWTMREGVVKVGPNKGEKVKSEPMKVEVPSGRGGREKKEL